MASTHKTRRRKPVLNVSDDGVNGTVAFGDFVVTALWVFVSSVFGEVSGWLTQATGMPELAVGVTITILALSSMGPLCAAFGGSVFNPLHNAALLVVGKGSLRFNLLRMAAQLVGAFTGSIAALKLLPPWLQGKFHHLPGGLKADVEAELGFLCECILGFLVNIVFLYSSEVTNKNLAFYTPMMATMAIIIVGNHFTGPSINPFVSFSWYWHFQEAHTMAVHISVYWVAPFLGAVLAGIFWRLYGHRLVLATSKSHRVRKQT